MFYLLNTKARLFQAICLGVAVCFLLTGIMPSQAFAQHLGASPALNTAPLSPAFTPTLVRGIRVYPDNPFTFDFIVDSGDTGLAGDALKKESEKLVRYFLASLTIPENNLWVNLSPHEKDRIVPDALGSTEMGRDMLSQDYLLKEITASLTNPDSDLGKEFWSKIYKQAYEQYGTTNIPVDTFNKVWIMPSKAEVYVQDDKAFIVDSSLKVMLEEDYLAAQESQKAKFKSQNENQPLNTNDQTLTTNSSKNKLASKVVREVFIPALEKEVNTGKNFAQLRQIYNCIILSYWYKTNLKDSILNKVYTNQHKVKGIDLSNKDTTDKIYAQYLETFKKGVCNMMKVEYDPYARKSIPRKYFAGGVTTGNIKDVFRQTEQSSTLLSFAKKAALMMIVSFGLMIGTAFGQNIDQLNPLGQPIEQFTPPPAELQFDEKRSQIDPKTIEIPKEIKKLDRKEKRKAKKEGRELKKAEPGKLAPPVPFKRIPKILKGQSLPGIFAQEGEAKENEPGVASSSAVTDPKAQEHFYDKKFRGKHFYRKDGDVVFLSVTSVDSILREKVAEKIINEVSILGRKNPRVLSIGEGQGHLAQTLQNKGLRIQSIDISEENIDAAREKGVNIIKGDAEHLDFPQNTFDVVVLNESIGGLNPGPALAEVLRVLKAGGRIVLTTYDTEKESVEQDPEFTHYVGHSVSEIENMLGGFNFIQHEEMESTVGLGTLNFFTAMKASSSAFQAPRRASSILISDLQAQQFEEDFLEERPLFIERATVPVNGKDEEVVFDASAKYLRVGPVIVISKSYMDRLSENFLKKSKTFIDQGVVVVDGSIPYLGYVVPLVASMLETDLTDKIVWDYGAGNGVLGLVALRLGAKKVIAVDLDAKALKYAQTGFENMLGKESVAYLKKNAWEKFRPQEKQRAFLLETDLNTIFRARNHWRRPIDRKFIKKDDSVVLANIGAFYQDVHDNLVKDAVYNKSQVVILGGYDQMPATDLEKYFEELGDGWDSLSAPWTARYFQDHGIVPTKKGYFGQGQDGKKREFQALKIEKASSVISQSRQEVTFPLSLVRFSIDGWVKVNGKDYFAQKLIDPEKIEAAFRQWDALQEDHNLVFNLPAWEEALRQNPQGVLFIIRSDEKSPPLAMAYAHHAQSGFLQYNTNERTKNKDIYFLSLLETLESERARASLNKGLLEPGKGLGRALMMRIIEESIKDPAVDNTLKGVIFLQSNYGDTSTGFYKNMGFVDALAEISTADGPQEVQGLILPSKTALKYYDDNFDLKKVAPGSKPEGIEEKDAAQDIKPFPLDGGINGIVYDDGFFVFKGRALFPSEALQRISPDDSIKILEEPDRFVLEAYKGGPGEERLEARYGVSRSSSSSSLKEAKILEDLILKSAPHLNIHRETMEGQDLVWDGNASYLRVGKMVVVTQNLLDRLEPEILSGSQRSFIEEKAVVAENDLKFWRYIIPFVSLMLKTDFTGKVVWDYGAGDGVLGLIALRLGAKRVIAIDNDGQELEKARMAFERQLGSREGIVYLKGKEWVSHKPALDEKVILIQGDLKEIFGNKLSEEKNNIDNNFANDDEAITLANVGLFYKDIIFEVLADALEGRSTKVILGGYEAGGDTKGHGVATVKNILREGYLELGVDPYPVLESQWESLWHTQYQAILIDKDQHSSSSVTGVKEQRSSMAFFAERFEANNNEVDFATFMTWVNNYYYNLRPQIGIGPEVKKSGFETFAEREYFGKAMARQLAQVWRIMVQEGKNKNSRFSIVETGAGNGTLARNILDCLQREEKDLYQNVEYTIVDFSGPLSEIQKETLSKHLAKVRFIKKSVFDVTADDLGPIEGAFISNELIDDVPGHVIQSVDGQRVFHEMNIRYENGSLEPVFKPLSRHLEEYLDRQNLQGIAAGKNFLIRPLVGKWQEMIAKSLQKGVVITIDYGGKFEENIEGSNPVVWSGADHGARLEDILKNPGRGEITANVNFEEIKTAGEDAGLSTAGFVMQRDFLNNWKADDGTVSAKESYDINLDSGFKALIQSKGIKDRQFRGFQSLGDGISRFYSAYQRSVKIRLPNRFLGTKEVYYADLNPWDDIPQNPSRMDKFIEDLTRGYPRKVGGYITVNSDNSISFDFRSGLMIRSDIPRLVLFDKKGNVIFNFKKFFEKFPEEKERCAFLKEDFIKNYSSRFLLGAKILPTPWEFEIYDQDGDYRVRPAKNQVSSAIVLANGTTVLSSGDPAKIKAAIAKNKKFRVLPSGEFGEPQEHKNEYTPLERVEEALGTFEAYYQKAGRHKKEVIWVEGGPGAGVALKQIALRLREQNIANVRLFGFGDTYFPEWAEGDFPEITWILDAFDNIERYFKPGTIDLFFSYFGLYHQKAAGENIGFALKLVGLLSAQGEVVYDYNQTFDETEQVDGLGLKDFFNIDLKRKTVWAKNMDGVRDAIIVHLVKLPGKPQLDFSGNPMYENFSQPEFGGGRGTSLDLLSLARDLLDFKGSIIPKDGVGLVVGFGNTPKELPLVKELFSFKKVHGVDFVNERVALASNFLNAGGYSLQDFPLHTADMNDMKNVISDNSIDLITAVNVTMSTGDNIDGFAKEIIRVLRPGGKVIVSTISEKSFRDYLASNGEIIFESGHMIIFEKRSGENKSEVSTGGIDFKAQNMNVDARGEKIDFALPDNMTAESLINAQGLVPVIINITPITNFFQVMGLAKEVEQLSLK